MLNLPYAVFSIDPGTTESAYAIQVLPITCAPIAFGKVPNDILLSLLSDTPSIDRYVIESIKSYGSAMGDSTIETCYWIGRFIERIHAAQHAAPILIPRKAVVSHVCNNPKANDSNVRQAVIDVYRSQTHTEDPIGKKKSPGPLYGVSTDVWSALAIGIASQYLSPNASNTPNTPRKDISLTEMLL